MTTAGGTTAPSGGGDGGGTSSGGTSGGIGDQMMGGGTASPSGGTTEPSGGTTEPSGGTTEPSGGTSWTTGLSDDNLATVQKKGWKDLNAVIGSYSSLEKVMGAPKERIIQLPEAGDSEGMMAIYDKLGRPKAATDYALSREGHEGKEDPSDLAFIRNAFHEIGVSSSQAEKFNEKYNAWIKTSKGEARAKAAEAVQEDVAKLQKEWGGDYEKNIASGQRAIKALGLGNEIVHQLESTMGPYAFGNFMSKVGASLGEHNFVGGEGPTVGMHTKEGAAAKIKELKNDPAFTKRLLEGDREAKHEWSTLHKRANPGTMKV